MDLSSNLKATTYEYQLSLTDGQDMENTRQTALVLEDMLRVVSGDLQSYPFQTKKLMPISLSSYELGGKRAVSLKSGKAVHVHKRMLPGEKSSNLQKKMNDERVKVEEEE